MASEAARWPRAGGGGGGLAAAAAPPGSGSADQRERERERGDSASGGREGEIETLARVCARRRRGCRRRRGSG